MLWNKALGTHFILLLFALFEKEKKNTGRKIIESCEKWKNESLLQEFRECMLLYLSLCVISASLFYLFPLHSVKRNASSYALTKNNTIRDIFLTHVTDNGRWKLAEHFHVWRKFRRTDLWWLLQFCFKSVYNF